MGERGKREMVWLGTKSSAEYLGITPRTLYRLIDEGQLTAYRFGRVIRVKQSDVDDFIRESRVEPGSLKHLYPEPRVGNDEDAVDHAEGEDDCGEQSGRSADTSRDASRRRSAEAS